MVCGAAGEPAAPDPVIRALEMTDPAAFSQSTYICTGLLLSTVVTHMRAETRTRPVIPPTGISWIRPISALGPIVPARPSASWPPAIPPAAVICHDTSVVVPVWNLDHS